MGCCGLQVSKKDLITFCRVRAVCTELSPVCVCGGGEGGLCRMQGLEVALVCLETVWVVGCLEGGRLVVKFSQ